MTAEIPLTRAEIHSVTQLGLSTLSRYNLKACLFGSVAGMIYGMEHRVPKDVDLMILNAAADQDEEEIKQLLVDGDDRFSLVNSRVVGATHRVLWCTLDDSSHTSTIASPASTPTPKRVCKVDVLTPDLLNITGIPESQLYTDPSSCFPAYFSSVDQQPPQAVPILYIPLFTILMLKLRAWADHSLPSANQRMHERIPQDEDDIQEILRISVLRGNCGTLVANENDEEGWRLGGFSNRKEAERYVRKFVKKWAQTTHSWRVVGFK